MRYRLGVLEKMLEEAEPLALDAGERRATREALRDQAAGLLYAASCEGLAAYLEAWRQLLRTAPVAALASPRQLLRACAHAAGWRR
jgi:hypothetical protein